MAISRSRLLVTFFGVSAVAAVAILRWVRVTRETPAEIVAEAQSEPEMPRVRVPIGTRSAPAKRVEFDNRLTGRVFGSDGRALADCSVALSTWATSPWGRIGERDRSRERVTRTDEDGRYVFEDVVPRGAYRLFVERADHSVSSQLSSRIGERGTFEQVAFVHAHPRTRASELSPLGAIGPPAVVTGRVVPANTNTPVTSFDVRLREAPADGPLTAVYDSAVHVESATGVFSVAGMPSWHNVSGWSGCVEVLVPGLGTGTSERFSFSRGMRVDDIRVEIRAGASLAGCVVDRSGAAVPGVRVRAVETAAALDFGDEFELGEMGLCSALALSGADGKYELHDVSLDSYDLVFDAPGFAYSRRAEVLVESAERIELGVTTMLRGATVRVRVVDAASRLGTRAVVALRDDQRTEFETQQLESEVEYVFEHVRPGPCAIRALGLESAATQMARWPDGDGAPYMAEDERQLVVYVNLAP